MNAGKQLCILHDNVTTSWRLDESVSVIKFFFIMNYHNLEKILQRNSSVSNWFI